MSHCIDFGLKSELKGCEHGVRCSPYTYSDNDLIRWKWAACSITRPHPFGPSSAFSHPPLSLYFAFPFFTHTHRHTLLFSVLPHSMSYCSFLRVSTFYSRPLGLLLPLLFSELWLLLHIKQERCPVMWPDVPRLPYTTLCAACVGWIGQCLPRPPWAP